MLERLPPRLYVAIFAVVAVACAFIVNLFPKHDYGLLFTSIPVFFVSALLGLRQSERRARRAEPPQAQAEHSST